MSIDFEELDYRRTPLGELVLRRRLEPFLNDREVFEIKLGDEFLMSSLFTEGEIALADLGLADLAAPGLDVVVGGLGLGYTADAALRHKNVQSVLVVEALDEVIEWHRRGLVPLGHGLTIEPRCRVVQGDFFALAMEPARGFDVQTPGRCFHAVLLDIDHSPRHWLQGQNQAFYEPDGLRHLTAHLHPAGAFAVWSNDRPDDEFLRALGAVFADARAHVVEFHNPYTNERSACTVYVARVGSDPGPGTEAP